jgi:hypothetical protein
MMTDKQLQALMSWAGCNAIAHVHGTNEFRHQEEDARNMLYAAFGFEVGEYGQPVVPQPPAICSNCGQPMGPGHVCTAGDITRQRLASAYAEHDAKFDAITKVLIRHDPGCPLLNADEIIFLWPELKAIMEPGNA